MRAPMPKAKAGSPSLASAPPANYAAETSLRQQQVWDSVRKTQEQLSANLGSAVRSAQSASSLQLALENEKLVGAQEAYVKALKAAGEAETDIVGYVFAVNGKLNSADVYPSNGLFRKMWAKLLKASVIEAIGNRGEAHADTPTMEAVTAFLADAERGQSSEKPLNAGVKLETREADNVLYFETTRTTGWVHRNYLAK
jgi:hypothetical protein